MTKSKAIIVTIILFSITYSCSTKKDNFLSREYHKLNTKYNVLFNANEALREFKKEKKASFEEDFTKILQIDPDNTVEIKEEKPSRNSALMSFFSRGASVSSNATGLDRAIEKARKAIKEHSMYIKDKERNKKIDDAYMTLGKAYYFSKKPFKAMEAFNYMKIYLPKNSDNYVNAYIWNAKSHIMAENYLSAIEELESVLKNTKIELSNQEKEQIYTVLYAAHRKNGSHKKSLLALQDAISYAKKKIKKVRYEFIKAQNLVEQGEKIEASRLFDKIIKSHPNLEFDLYSNIWISSNFENGKHEYKDFLSELETLSKKGKFKPFLSEIYYQMGVVSQRAKDTKLSKKYFAKSTKQKTKKDTKALAYSKLGDINFDENHYLKAYKYYDSAKANIKNEESFSNKMIAKKLEKLKDLSSVDEKILANDSIIKLAKMPISKREKIYKKHIANLKKEDKENDDFDLSEFEEFQSNNVDRGFSNNSEGGKWYFYNKVLSSKGSSKFRKTWGDIELKDNWKFLSKIQSKTSSENISDFDENSFLENDENKDFKKNRYNLKYYLDKIPSGEKLDALVSENQDNKYKIAEILADKFEEYKTSNTHLKNLIKQDIDDNLLSKSYFKLYENSSKINDSEKDIYRKKYLETVGKSTSGEEVDLLELYKKTYDLYEKENFVDAKINIEKAKKQIENKEITPKFMLLEAIINIRNGQEGKTILEEIVKKYPNSEQGNRAKKILKYVE